MKLPCFILAGVLLALVVSGCESTQSRSAKLESEGADLVHRKTFDVGAENRQIDVVEKVVLTDVNGSAVAVVLKNNGTDGLSDAPISVNVKDAKGKSVFRNNLAGTEFSLLHVPVVKPKSEVFWVHDQILAVGGKPSSVDVTVGEAKPLPADIPEIQVSPPRLQRDPVSGLEVTGTAVNKSDVEQSDLILYAIGRKNGKIVAAGRGLIPKLKTDGTPASYHIFFIGNPTGADISVIAPPVTLSGGTS
ncbi:MAG: hypothetical protein KDB66_08550 [Solirubrobacterales bacterium]|nr:hypothetical protein [Solirubrobacterales bacterium]MCB8915937.1 hypothetical protein [Thermoleophilales bacterium]